MKGKRPTGGGQAPAARRRAATKTAPVDSRRRGKKDTDNETAVLQRIIDLLPAPIFVFQGERNILVNPAAEALTGYTAGELLEMRYWEVVHPDFRDLIRTRGSARQAGASVPGRYEVKILTKSGESRWLDFTGGLIHLRGEPAVIGTVIDLTERKLAEQGLQDQLKRMAAMREIALAISSTLDLRGVLDVLLREADTLLPYAATMLRLKNPATGRYENVACRNIDEEEWKRGAGRRGGRLSETIVRTRAPLAVRNLQTGAARDISEFFRRQGFVSYLGVPLIAKGEILGILSFCTREDHEFTPEETTFLSTLASQAALAIHNSRLYEESKNQALALQEANRLKDEFLGFVSHELRTPLNAVIGYAGMIQDNTFGATTAEQRKALGKVSGHAKHLLHMINSLLETTKIEVGAAQPDNREVSVTALLDELKSSYETPLGKDLSLEWVYADPLPTIRTDLQKLRHILQNLVDNAIKFTDRGTVTISAAPLPGDKSVQFKVADSGIGIPPETVPTIFDRFRQGPAVGAGAAAGVGLGLHIAKKFTEMLGGKIDVQSKIGKGSTFTVTIPSSL